MVRYNYCTIAWEETPGQTQNTLEGLHILLAWERLGITQEELESVAGEKEAWGALLRQLPPRPGPEKAVKIMDGWMDDMNLTLQMEGCCYLQENNLYE